MDFVTEISFCKTLVVDEKNVDFSNRQGLKSAREIILSAPNTKFFFPEIIRLIL